MSTSVEYLELLREHRDAPAEELVYQHQLFWVRHRNSWIGDLEDRSLNAYHLGILPSRVGPSDVAGWHLDPQIGLQRTGLYADSIVFDDLVGQVLGKWPHVPVDQRQALVGPNRGAISTLLALRELVVMGVAKILPSDQFLRAERAYPESSHSLPVELSALDHLSLVESLGTLPDEIRQMLSPDQRDALTGLAGHVLNYKINKALLLKERLDLVPEAEDGFYDIFCATLNWNHRILEDTSNLYLLRKIKPRYLCTSLEVLQDLRERDSVAEVRRFLRGQAHAFFGDDVEARSGQQQIDEFSRALTEQMAAADAELTSLRRKLKTELVFNAGQSGLSVAITIGVDYGANLASWIPQFIGAMPVMKAGTSIINAIKEYIYGRGELRAKPAFLLGSQLGRHDG